MKFKQLVLVIGLALLCNTLANAQEGTPVNVQPAPLPAAVQVTPSITVQPERLMLWGGLSSEFYILPGLFFGVSGPVGKWEGVNLVLRGSVEMIGNPGESFDGTPVYSFLLGNADLLFTTAQPGVRWYAGPTVGTLNGTALVAGAVAGSRNEFGGGSWGWFAEGKVRAAFAPASSTLVSPGLRFGVTYRF